MEQENKVYAKSFRFSQEGHAVWPKVLSNDLRPGACGYVNGYGDWVTILQLCDADAIKKLKLKPLNGIGETNDGGDTTWTAKTSNKVVGSAIQLDAEATPPGAAVGGNAGVKYTCEDKRGAVLLARGAVTRAWLTGVGAMKAWVGDNIETLVQEGDFDSIKKRGFWVVTKIYHTSECAKTVMQSKNTTASIHVGASVPDVAGANASASWWNAEQVSSGWVIHRAKKPNTEGEQSETNEKEEQGVVMFFGGIWWKPGGLFSKEFKAEEDKKKQQYLGADPLKTPSTLVQAPNGDAAEPEGTYLKLSAGRVGENPELTGLPEFKDSFAMYSINSDSDSD